MALKKWRKQNIQPASSNKRFEIGFQMLAQWLYLKQNGKTLAPFFEDNVIKSIAIYGMGVLGKRLHEELKGEKIDVKYGIDRNEAVKTGAGFKIYGADERCFPEADAIVVTPVQDYWEIVRGLEGKTKAAIVSLEDVIEYAVAGDGE